MKVHKNVAANEKYGGIYFVFKLKGWVMCLFLPGQAINKKIPWCRRSCSLLVWHPEGPGSIPTKTEMYQILFLKPLISFVCTNLRKKFGVNLSFFTICAIGHFWCHFWRFVQNPIDSHPFQNPTLRRTCLYFTCDSERWKNSLRKKHRRKIRRPAPQRRHNLTSWTLESRFLQL